MKKCIVCILALSIFLTACGKSETKTETTQTSASATTTTTNPTDENWVELGKESNGLAIDYYKPDSQKQMDGYEVVAVKIVLINDDKQRNLKTGEYLISAVAVDCKKHQAGLLKSKIYNADKTLKTEINQINNLKMKDVIKGKPMGIMVDKVCVK